MTVTWWGWLVRQARRALSFGFGLRLGIAGSGALALWLAVPQLNHWGWYAFLIGTLPLVAALAPAKPFATLVQLQAVVMLLVNGYLVEEISPLVAIGVGVCCYLLHACAAMAALWRVDTVAESRVWQGWLARIGGVVTVSAVLAGVVVAVSGQPIEGPPALMAAAAACLALAVVSGVAWLYHRRSS
ncbi:hypothetical protein [Stackebrandtia nassauensis]|uniref:Uncharacterized protein n=1 Tax=Stackebrandtia nassauensis (strain DSM 44728 / CIP 108903 / NRRL B-16338 / NBRC 102104 / LLR-40K-21) TaxID=446470 RepID=D3PZN9_STANL|nr:hypothetical protein [Stackebrandtia nassauensis]ADD43576.1 hypothetical protein Snas_3921 [Stackebrandtia nassauensis DSM 44728]